MPVQTSAGLAPLRIEFPGAVYHVTSRGNRREDIYTEDAGRRYWLNILATCALATNGAVTFVARWIVMGFLKSFGL